MACRPWGVFQSVVEVSSTVTGPVSPAVKRRWMTSIPWTLSASGDSSPVGL